LYVTDVLNNRFEKFWINDAAHSVASEEIDGVAS
jgi:hypothetical protein